MKLSDAIERVARLADAIRSYRDTELPKRHPRYPLVQTGEDSGPPAPEEEKLKNLLAELPDDVLYKLTLIMYVGRGDFGTEDLAAGFEHVKEAFPEPEYAASQLSEKASLADYLTEGLAELRRNGIDVDDLTFALARSVN